MKSSAVTLVIFALLLSRLANSKGVKKGSKGGSKKGNLEEYQAAVDAVAENINKATEKSEALIDKHMAAVDKDPGSLITKEALKKMASASSFLPQKAGTRSIIIQSDQGFNGISNYQPAGWKITETMSGPTDKKEEPTSAKEPVFTYPAGLGPVLLNGCTGTNYSKTSPCYNSKLFNLENTVCLHQMDAANYIGVGFDGRGYYRAESRRSSLIQRVCAGRARFMGQDIPDTMNVFGIFETRAETKSFQSVDQYMKYIREKAGLSNQRNLFTSEASRYTQATSFGANLGGVGAIIGGAIGAYAGGPVGAAMGATLGGAIGGSIGGGSGSGSGSESSMSKGSGSSKVEQTDKSSNKKQLSQSFFAIMYVNIVLYEITLDDVKPTDINLAALRDYMSLPVSYYSVGADVKYQNFLLRWGTHFIRSGKFGGQLKITKIAKTNKIQSEEQFAKLAETEFQSMFSTLQSKYSQQSSSWGFLGFGGASKSTNQNSQAKSQSSYTSTMNQQNQLSQSYGQSEFTQTSVEAQGGTPEIAEALVDFYTPSFKQLYHDWIVSIKDYAKPFEFQLRPIDQLFNLNMDSLFPAGNTDFGCVDGTKNVKILVDPDTKMRYYIDTFTTFYNNDKVEKKRRINCKYSSISDFKKDMERRMMSLEKAVGVYMIEGPFPTSSFELPGGQPGCEENTVAKLNLFSSGSTSLKYADLLRQPFIIAFNLPESVPDIVTSEAKYVMVYRLNRWFAVEPNEKLMNLYEGCQVENLGSGDKKVCFRNLILTYEESTGLFHIERADFAASKQRIPSLPYWLSGTTVARSKPMVGPMSSTNTLKSTHSLENRAAIPCNVKWLNSHRLDPDKPDNCIHFTAATEGDLFVIFSSVPRDHSTWYYLQITPEGVAFYYAMAMQKRDQKKGMGVLGDRNLYQSFFVCVIQNVKTVTMQYGKADPDSEVGTVYAAYTFVPDSQFSRLSFYSFGSGYKSVSLMDIRLTKKMPQVACLGDDYVKKNDQCVLDCHAECSGCNQARDSKACQQCKHVRIVTGSGAEKATECVAQCPAGMYMSETKDALCVPCEAGTFKTSTGNQKCSKCPIGSSSPQGATVCSDCPAGTFSVARQRCVPCPAGKFAAKGAPTCSLCPAGQFSEQGQSECNPCPYGKYGHSAGMGACLPCDVGFFADTRGLTACKRCPAGSSSVRGARTCENSCRRGEFSPRLGVGCIKCPPGKFAESRGSAACSLCPVGHYQGSSGQANCVAAPPGSYVASTGASTFQRCPAGTFNDKSGESRRTACRPCSPGSYSSSSGSSSCNRCPINHYSTGGQAPCSKCSDFQFAEPNSARCTDCPGNALVKSGQANCYRRISFQRCLQSGSFNSDSRCEKATDGSRGMPPFISQSAGTKYFSGRFLWPLPHIKKIVLWRRTDCCLDQFAGIEVRMVQFLGIGSSRVRHCGTVPNTSERYFVMDCDVTNAMSIMALRTTGNWIAITELEAYTD